MNNEQRITKVIKYHSSSSISGLKPQTKSQEFRKLEIQVHTLTTSSPPPFFFFVFMSKYVQLQIHFYTHTATLRDLTTDKELIRT